MINRKQKVILVARELFLEKGFTETSVQDILVASGISKGTFYNYFSTKNECLIAILEQAQEEANIRRNELLIQAQEDGKNVFAKQIIVRMQVNREHNLLPLLGTVFHAKDTELRQFVRKKHLHELAWLSRRFVDLYGDEVRPYAVDCAITVLGMIQQYNLAWSFYAERELELEKLVCFILRRMDVIVADLIQKQESLIDEQLVFAIQKEWKEISCSKEKLLGELEAFARKFSKEDQVQQVIEFIITEMNAASPRHFLLEMTTRSFYNYFHETEHEAKARELSEKLLQCISN